MDQDKINELRKKELIEVWFAIEAVGVTKEAIEDSMKNHISKLEKVSEMQIYDKVFRPIEKLEDISFLPKNITEAWSQVVELKFFVKKFDDLINIIYVYGPSAVEVLGPESKKISIQEMQDISNTLAGLLHQFAAAGVGGVVITPK
ncbi:MAG: hypothetical protein HY831_04025 [Candidatus Aenigmarchaeota archaeon]|nr:hypothetical protein [Candidatus Aenigmarchaeota archaeon]